MAHQAEAYHGFITRIKHQDMMLAHQVSPCLGGMLVKQASGGMLVKQASGGMLVHQASPPTPGWDAGPSSITPTGWDAGPSSITPPGWDAGPSSIIPDQTHSSCDREATLSDSAGFLQGLRFPPTYITNHPIF
jgi:hypothetical protein